MCHEDVDAVRSVEWNLPGDHLVQDDAEGIDVRPRVDPVSLDLFGRHVLGAAHEQAGLGKVFALGLRDVLHEAEVEHFDEVRLVAVLDEEDVRRLEVAVDDAERVCASRKARQI